MADEDVRRLLWYAQRELQQAFKEAPEDLPNEEIAVRHFCILSDSGYQKFDEATDRSLGKLGVRVIRTHLSSPRRPSNSYVGETS